MDQKLKNMKERLRKMEALTDQLLANIILLRQEIAEEEKLEKEKNPEGLKELQEKKKIFGTNIPDEVTLREAEEIRISELMDLSTRAQRAIDCGNISNLKELYRYVLKDPKFKRVRNVGDQTAEEIRQIVLNMSEVIKEVKRRREIVEKEDTPINELLSEKAVKHLERNFGIRTIQEVYKYENFMDFPDYVRVELKRVFVKF